jgi:hypothetical protein
VQPHFNNARLAWITLCPILVGASVSVPRTFAKSRAAAKELQHRL